jgi:predicted transcriptional regulator
MAPGSGMQRFGELEATIMDRSWQLGRSPLVREMVDDLLEDRALAYTTVMTVMDNLYRKGSGTAARGTTSPPALGPATLRR